MPCWAKVIVLTVVLQVVSGDGGEVLKSVDKYKCKKHIDYLEWSGGKERCDYGELSVTKGMLDVVGRGDAGLDVRLLIEGVSAEGFEGSYDVLLRHEDTDESISLEGAPFAVSPPGVRADHTLSVPTPRKGWWIADVVIHANSGSVLGKLTFEFKLTSKMLKRNSAVGTVEVGTDDDKNATAEL
eukprot:TRINITY_DN3248_c4_g1_i1.p1 TRINITY_DN3248_c4_g1~~TRINITY_DN3248_c4_g1_i1.p1  ORF type:complete len:184 (+),score=41.62 TRINITY_DN3248_c4_g1_i1:100-651(+)